jgi:hypothetical protein
MMFLKDMEFENPVPHCCASLADSQEGIALRVQESRSFIE